MKPAEPTEPMSENKPHPLGTLSPDDFAEIKNKVFVGGLEHADIVRLSDSHENERSARQRAEELLLQMTAVREDKPAQPGEKFDAEKWAERTITWLANEGAAWIGSTTTDENWGHRMASPEGLAVCRNIMRDNYRAAYAAGLAARDGERVRPTWHTTGRYCCNCGKLLSQHINQRHCHPNKADVYESPSQPPAPEVRP